MKKCYSCERKLPLFIFTTNKRKYQNATNKGRNYVCRLCLYKTWSAQGWAWLWNRKENKFSRVEFKSKWQIIKRIFNK